MFFRSSWLSTASYTRKDSHVLRFEIGVILYQLDFLVKKYILFSAFRLLLHGPEPLITWPFWALLSGLGFVKSVVILVTIELFLESMNYFSLIRVFWEIWILVCTGSNSHSWNVPVLSSNEVVLCFFVPFSAFTCLLLVHHVWKNHQSCSHFGHWHIQALFSVLSKIYYRCSAVMIEA